jgi:hypothetical protein
MRSLSAGVLMKNDHWSTILVSARVVRLHPPSRYDPAFALRGLGTGVSGFTF